MKANIDDKKISGNDRAVAWDGQTRSGPALHNQINAIAEDKVQPVSLSGLTSEKICSVQAAITLIGQRNQVWLSSSLRKSTRKLRDARIGFKCGKNNVLGFTGGSQKAERTGKASYADPYLRAETPGLQQSGTPCWPTPRSASINSNTIHQAVESKPVGSD